MKLQTSPQSNRTGPVLSCWTHRLNLCFFSGPGSMWQGKLGSSNMGGDSCLGYRKSFARICSIILPLMLWLLTISNILNLWVNYTTSSLLIRKLDLLEMCSAFSSRYLERNSSMATWCHSSANQNFYQSSSLITLSENANGNILIFIIFSYSTIAEWVALASSESQGKFMILDITYKTPH